MGCVTNYLCSFGNWLFWRKSFYDSFLTDVADNQQMDAVSTTGYGMGYLGGVLAFIIFLGAQLTGGFNGLLSSYGIAKFSFILAAVWWVIFAWPLLRTWASVP